MHEKTQQIYPHEVKSRPIDGQVLLWGFTVRGGVKTAPL